MNTDGLKAPAAAGKGWAPQPRLLSAKGENAPAIQARRPPSHCILSALRGSDSVNDTCQDGRLVHKPIFLCVVFHLGWENSQFLARETHITAVKCQYKLWDAVVNSPN